MIKQILIQLTVAALVSSCLAIELIEHNDHNNNLMPLDTGKSLWIVQEAIKNGYKFEHVSDAAKFVDRCKYLSGSLKGVAETEYEGLAGKLKAILADAELSKYCAMQETELVAKFGLLDSKDMGVQVTSKRMQDMIELGEELHKNPEASVMLSDLFERSKQLMGHNLLVHAGEDTSTFFGEEKPGLFNLQSLYQEGCSISSLKPICKLIRKTDQDDVSALGSDVEDFIELMTANDQVKINKHVETSGVTLEQLKETCTAISGNFHALRVLDTYVDHDFVSEAMLDEQSKVEPYFYLYYQIHRLCKLSTGRD